MFEKVLYLFCEPDQILQTHESWIDRSLGAFEEPCRPGAIWDDDARCLLGPKRPAKTAPLFV